MLRSKFRVVLGASLYNPNKLRKMGYLVSKYHPSQESDMYPIPDDVEELERLVIHLATCEAAGNPCVDFDGDIVEDTDYDDLLRTLRKRKPDSEVFEPGRVTPASVEETGDTIDHNPPMTSIEKADGTDEEKVAKLTSWITRCNIQLKYDEADPNYVKSFKQDGVAFAVKYKDGMRTEGGLRPNKGTRGTNVTRNIAGIKGLPEKLPLPLTLELRGELVCLQEDFQAVQKERALAGEEERANPRNHTYGSINQQDGPERTAKGKISFIGYSVVNFDDSAKYYTTEIERAKWVNKVLGIRFVRVEILDTVTIDAAVAELNAMEAMIKELPYEVDGVVLKVNNLEDQEQLGHHGDDPIKEPHGAMAWKFREERDIATVRELTWQAGRTGKITPVGWFLEPCKLAGTKVYKASVANFGLAERMQIGEGSKVEVGKAGKIIPRIYAVLDGKVDKLTYPTVCPACKNPLEVVPGHKGNKELMCHNKECSAKHIIRLCFFLEMIGAKGLKESKIERIIQGGKVKDQADLFELDITDFVQADFGTREGTLAWGTIHKVKPNRDNDKLITEIRAATKKKKVLPFWQFFASLGVPRAGKTAGSTLQEHYNGDFAAVRAASLEELQNISGIGEVSGNNIFTYLQEKSELLDRLLQHIELEQVKTDGKLFGKSFVLSGTLPPGRGHWGKLIEEQGGKVSGSVSKKTSYLVLGPDGGSKRDEAARLNVPIIDLDQLQKLWEGI